MTRGGRQIDRRKPHRRLPIACAFAHRHARILVRSAPSDVQRKRGKPGRCHSPLRVTARLSPVS
jgi:hypothetical protein